ncbi:hypothetical protein AMATHDRAFT_63345 [Amanita thiersii Skay4041]|uniref:Uncharacterized protein n=1 Tax=Amanita thiersii Skay4041 TaxID=703135 RepID=A0A2A9NH39_9AGAR|nr:hypothetical protein AMATHDRAFT_63345 [Amanita thiersii Skay4041]
MQLLTIIVMAFLLSGFKFNKATLPHQGGDLLPVIERRSLSDKRPQSPSNFREKQNDSALRDMKNRRSQEYMVYLGLL